jgi:hypothetical protein
LLVPVPAKSICVIRPPFPRQIRTLPSQPASGLAHA